MRVTGIEHVQLAMPQGEEQRAREFYSRILGIPEVPKPPELAKRGGAWFESQFLKVHLGVESDFRPARKAHPALLVEDLPSLVLLLRAKGYSVIDNDALEGFFRVYVSDPFGNRIELMEPWKKSQQACTEMSEFTAKQGQYLAFIYYYSKVNGRTPSEADIQRYFDGTPPSVHHMLLSLERFGFISRVPQQARSIKLLVSREQLPDLE